jgi:hypothetical protein
MSHPEFSPKHELGVVKGAQRPQSGQPTVSTRPRPGSKTGRSRPCDVLTSALGTEFGMTHVFGGRGASPQYGIPPSKYCSNMRLSARPSHGSESSWGAAYLDGNDFIRNPYGHGWLLDRARFDASLRERARDAVAAVLEEVRPLLVTREYGDGWLLVAEAPCGPRGLAA